MIITLNNGVSLNPIMATGGSSYVQGANRDVLIFVFPETESMAELDAVFSAENCVSIAVKEETEEGTNEYIHTGYTIRAGLEKKPVEVTPATDTEPAVMENRIFVKMAQRTYTEAQMADLQKTVDYLVLDSLS